MTDRPITTLLKSRSLVVTSQEYQTLWQFDSNLDIPFGWAVVKLSADDKTLVSVRIFDATNLLVLGEVSLNVTVANEIVALEVALAYPRIDSAAIYEIAVRTLHSPVRIYAADLYPVRSVVDQLADLGHCPG